AGGSPVMHDFWKQESPEQRMNDMNNFTKNMALAGGAIALMGVEEPWPVSAPLLQSKPRNRGKRFLPDIAACAIPARFYEWAGSWVSLPRLPESAFLLQAQP